MFTVGKSTEDVRIRIPDVYRDVVTYGFVYDVFARVQFNETRSGFEVVILFSKILRVLMLSGQEFWCGVFSVWMV